MAKKQLTDPFIKGYNPPDEKSVSYSDTILPGLSIRFNSGGSKTFSFRYYINGKQKRYTLGKYPALKLAEARRAAREIAEQVSTGTDPQADKVQSREDLTIKELAEEFDNKHLPNLKESTQVDYRERIKNVIVPALGSIIARKVTADDVLDLLEEIAEGAPIQSNRIRAILSSIYTFGQKRRFVKVNPILSIPKLGKENQRDRFFTADEIKKAWAIIEKLDEPVRSLYKILFITGQRLGETRQMKWDYIDNRTWFIPEELTKAKRSHALPLPPMAMEILKDLQKYTGGSDYVFQSPVKDNQPITWVHWHAKSIRDHKEGVSDFRIHDIRRTVTSYMAELGVDRTTLGKVLNHKQLAGDNHVTARYDRYDYMDEKRLALNKWAAKLQEIISGSQASGTKIYKLWS